MILSDKKFISYSIITPVYNRKREIVNCINSVANQHYPNYEHIIIDDGSIDGTIDIINSKAANDNNIKPLVLLENWGVNTARNRGIEKAKNDYILFLDSDDLLINNSLFVINHEVLKNNNYSHYLFVPDDKILYYSQNELLKNKVTVEITFQDWLRKKIDGDFVHLISTDLCKKFLFPEVKGLLIREGPNFLRYHRESKKQLFINNLVLKGDINRTDSITYKVQPINYKSLYSTYLTKSLHFQWFSNDLLSNNCSIEFISLLKEIILLGIILTRYDEIVTYFDELKKINKDAIYLKLLRYFRLGLVLRYILYIKTHVKLFFRLRSQ